MSPILEAGGPTPVLPIRKKEVQIFLADWHFSVKMEIIKTLAKGVIVFTLDRNCFLIFFCRNKYFKKLSNRRLNFVHRSQNAV